MSLSVVRYKTKQDLISLHFPSASPTENLAYSALGFVVPRPVIFFSASPWENWTHLFLLLKVLEVVILARGKAERKYDRPSPYSECFIYLLV